jgi:hypothetical protein
VETQIVTHVPATLTQQGIRARLIALLGPVTALAGVLWAFVQPERVTLLHPRGQGFWWLLLEPPLLVIAVGLFFALAIARPLLADIEEYGGTQG